MLKRIFLATVLSISLLSSGTIAQAQDQAPASGKQIAPNQNVGDPNERICEKITLVGSRLATKKFCGTRAEWAERKRQDREALEAAQRSPCMLTHNSGNGKPAC
jgi:hypothetical protein